MVTTPRALAYGYPWLDSINHELVHYAVSTLTGDRAPVWLQEGLAKFLERRWREPAGGRIPPGDGAPAGQGAALGQAHHLRGDAPVDGEAAVRRGRDAGVRRGRQRRSPTCTSKGGHARAARRDQARRRRRRRARRGGGAPPACSWPEFERGWRAFMAAQHYKTFPAIDIPTTHIRKPGAIASGRKPAEEDALSATLKAGAPVPPPAARQHAAAARPAARRGRRVRKGGEGDRPAADATRGDPSATWVFPVKLGRTYLALGEPDRALKALAPVQALYPDLPWPNLIAGEALVAKGEPAEAPGPAARGAGHQPVRPARALRAGGAYGKLPVAERPPAAACARAGVLPEPRRSASNSSASVAQPRAVDGLVAERRVGQHPCWP